MTDEDVETQQGDGSEDVEGDLTSLDGPSSVFEELLGSRGRVKMLEAFLNQAGTSVTAGEIAEFAGFSESTFSRYIDLFLELELVEKDGQIGNTTLYRLNEDSNLASAFGQAQYYLRKQVGQVSSEDWLDRDRDPVVEQEPDELKSEVAQLVPDLFVLEDETERVTRARRLQEIVEEEPSIAVDVVPALVELAEDENREVSQLVVTALSHIVSYDPESVDQEEISKLLSVVPDALKTAQEIELNDNFPDDEPPKQQTDDDGGEVSAQKTLSEEGQL